MQAAFEEDPPRDFSALMLPEEGHEADSLLLNIDGFEGPIDVLLEMARNQKVDLREISILQLVRQYLDFIERAKHLRLDLAAEYLVMAAWLAYLKSRLLLPREKDETGEPSGEAMAEALQFQLRRLESMRDAAAKLLARPQLGINIFGRGAPEGLRTAYNATYKDTLYDMLKAYGDIRRRAEASIYELPVFNIMTMEEAIERMSKMLGNLPKSGIHSVWTTLQSFIPDVTDPLLLRSSLASTLTAGLELAKQGKVEIRQDGLFRPVYIRTSNRPPLVDEPREEAQYELEPIKIVDLDLADTSAFVKNLADCIILTHDHKIMLQYRPLNWETSPGRLTAFGGHVEDGENVMDALVRELNEELGADVAAADVLTIGAVTEEFTGHTELVHIHFWHDKKGTITGCYEAEAQYFDTVEEALANSRLMDYAKWALQECEKLNLLEKRQ